MFSIPAHVSVFVRQSQSDGMKEQKLFLSTIAKFAHIIRPTIATTLDIQSGQS